MTPRPATSTTGGAEDAAARLLAARRVLVTGLVNASFEAGQVACDLAEALGAVVDFGAADLERPAGPTSVRVGAVTADPEEMRDRADLVILWGCDGAAIDPKLMPPEAPVLTIPPVGTSAVDAARILQHLLSGGEPPALETVAPLVEACGVVRAAIEKASCVAFVTDDSADDLGLEAWSIMHLVRAIAHRKPAFLVPLRAAEHAAAEMVCTWRYGAAGGIARADRTGGRFLPAEASARRLIERREVDCVLAIGRLTDGVAALLSRCGPGMPCVRVDADADTLRNLLARVSGRPRKESS